MTVKIEAEEDIDIRCAECGARLDGESHRRSSGVVYKIMPCADCIEKAEDKAREESSD